MTSSKAPQILSYPTNKMGLKAAKFFLNYLKLLDEKKNIISIALSGGSTPKALYTHVIKIDKQESINWDKVHFFWSDERNVSLDHKDSNYYLANEFLLKPLNIKKDNIHPIQTHYTPQDAAKKYHQTIFDFFGQGKASFDLMMLGLGDDTHTASLFPGTGAMLVKNAYAINVYVPKLDTHRITMTPTLINQSQKILFLAKGEQKIQAFLNVLMGKTNIQKYPAQSIEQNPRKTTWIIDNLLAKGIQS